MSFLTLSEAKDRLVITSNYRDTDINRMIEQAQAVVENYIKGVEADYTDASDLTRLKLATAIVTGNILDHEPPLSQGVIDILTPYRDPTLA